MVAQRWIKLGRRVVDDLDAVGVMANLRDDAGTDLEKLKRNYHTVKKVVYDLQPFHPDYRVLMDAKKEELVASADLDRIKAFNEFEDLCFKRQVHIQIKVRLGDRCIFKHEDDIKFIKDKLVIIPLHIAEDFDLTPAEKRGVAAAQRQRGAARGSNVITVTYVDQLIEQCRQWLVHSTDPMELCVALGVATGRRPIELWQYGTFTEHPTHGDNYRVVFGGQAKTGLNGINSLDTRDDGIPPYSIPIMAPKNRVISALQRLRQVAGTDNMTSTQVNSKYSSKLNAFVKANVHRDMTFRDLRTLYLVLTWELFKPHRYGINDWGQRVLGHSTVNMSTHYTRMQYSGLTNRYRRNDFMDYVL